MKDNEQKVGFFARVGTAFRNVGKTVARWCARMFMGASKSMASEDIFAIENLESPAKMAVKTFFRRKLAVTALVVLVALFLLVFIGPLIWPMDVNFTDPNQANIGPCFSMRSVPSALKKEGIRSISSKGTYSVGVSEENTLYIWGYDKEPLFGYDYGDFPEEITEGGVFMAGAGSDFVFAVTTDGKLVAWGDNNRGQYGYLPKNANADDPLETLPEEFFTEGLDTSKLTQIVCGYQAGGMVYDGDLYLWGNRNTCLNMKDLVRKNYSGVKKYAMTNYYGLVLMEDGTLGDAGYSLSREFVKNRAGEVNTFSKLKGSHKVVDIAGTKQCFAILLDNGDILVQGAAQYGEDEIAQIPEGETPVSISSGAWHFTVMTDAGKAYTWGSNAQGQCDESGVECAKVFAGSYQTYFVDEEGDLIDSCGLRGYFFGTDGLGRDNFVRLIHGGKMTMTIGAVAVIISSVIAIIVGCVSGYFGGWVDMLLMRITELFSAIPFLPFAMMLSYVMTFTTVGETARIFIIMVILGILSWTGLAHMIRGQVLAEREKEFVLAAKAMGIKERRIAFKHILPNVISVILVSMTLDFAGCLLTESSLSYLGFGVQQPRPTWGNMLDKANNSIVIQNYWWQWLFPAIFLAIATISINIIGDTLRDVLDPKSSREK